MGIPCLTVRGRQHCDIVRVIDHPRIWILGHAHEFFELLVAEWPLVGGQNLRHGFLGNVAPALRV